MRLSLLELPTLVRRALLVAGLPRGAADVAARMIAWTEMERGDGLAFLESHLPAIARAAGATPRLVRRDGHDCVVAADGASPLLWAPLALDLATAAARRAGVGLAHVPDGADAPPLGWMADRAARRGLVAFLARPCGPAIGLPGDGAPWRIEPRAPDAAAPAGSCILEWALPGRSASALAAWLAGRMAHPTGDGGVSLFCAAPGAFGADCVPAALAALRERAIIRTPQDATARHAAAMRDGLEVDDALWRRLRAFGDRVLVPTSERSRQGAG